MNVKKYNWILYLISATIVVTIAVQLYWNYKNYLENKQNVTNEIQTSLDIAVDEYYSSISKYNFLSILSSDSTHHKKSILKEIEKKKKFKISSVEIKTNNRNEYDKIPEVLNSLFINDTILQASFSTKKNLNDTLYKENLPSKFYPWRKYSDSIRLVKGIQSVFIALTNDSINFHKLDSLFENQLQKRDLNPEHYFVIINSDSTKISSENKKNQNFDLFASSKSTYLRENEQLLAYYKNPSIEALKMSSTGILLSFLLSLTVISSLFYLLKIINKQKEVAAIKNDLISNITHEFKTPIATISAAIEAIENFNEKNDKEKTNKYLSMSQTQLSKLHQMVEKLLETATLDSDVLLLSTTSEDLVSFVEKITKKHQVFTTEKSIKFSSNVKELTKEIDVFHFENAVSNLIDNAIKYGGNEIEVSILSILNRIEISVADNGVGIEKNQLEKIFDKFYRIPTGNKHDIKGFGIGLYYTKTIIEKHQGAIEVSSKNGTVFKIILSNE